MAMESFSAYSPSLESVSSLWSGLMAQGFLVGSCTAVGAAVFLLVARKLLVSTYKTFLRPAKNLKKLGEWAVVTGATDGIGKAYAFALAKKGMNVVIISRTESKLQEVKREIDDKGYGVNVKYLVCDYSKFTVDAREAIAKELRKLDIGVLINNVGASYEYPRYFHELPQKEIQHILTMNIDSTVWMTEMVLSGMVDQKRGTIVNLSSAAGRYTNPLLAEYAAAKSFIEKFSTSINAEYRSMGITCQCQAPFFVATKLAKMRKAWYVPTPEEYVALGIKWIGYPDDIVSPFFIHAFFGWWFLTLPEFFTTAYFFNASSVVRRKALAKQEREAKKAKEANGGLSSPKKTTGTLSPEKKSP